MQLKKLELQGFKSFADKTVLDFKQGITTVIGPNGSGKSNISDAIRWVLGEQSMKNLRGAKTEDIIFAGTQNRKSLGFAEVSMVLDNQDGKLPLEFSEVTVTRRIYRSGESGYFINKTPCRLKDIQELFMDTGIGKDGYSIISQGKIDEILSNKSEDRRKIFEEAAGIVKYRVRKQETERKLEQTKLNLLRINDILSEIEGKIEPLKNQSEKAKKFLELRDELKNIEIGLFIHQIDSYKEKLNDVLENLDIFVSQENEEEQKLQESQKEKEEIRAELDNIIVEIENIQNNNIEATKKEEKLNADINIFKERIENNKNNSENSKQEIEGLEKRNAELEEEKSQKNDKKENLLSNKEKFEKELKEKEEILERITEKLSTEERNIEGKKQIIQKNIDLKYEKSSLISNQDVILENLKKRALHINDDISAKISELDALRLQKEENSKKYREIEINKQQVIKEQEEINNKKEEANEKIKEYETSIIEKQNELRLKQSRYNFLVETEKEKEGYNKTVKSLLIECEKNAELSKGVEGVLANLISTDKKYETAVEMCLGGVLQNIVTRDEQDAKKVIEFLRKNNLGRASFLPISNIRGKAVENIDKKGIENDVIGVLSDLVKTEKQYEQIVVNLLGKTVLAKNMDVAIKLSKQNKNSFRIVTMDGDIINTTGSMTGGSVAKKTVNILGRGQEIKSLESEISKISSEIEKISKEQNEYMDSIEDILELAGSIERKLQEIEIEYATYKEKISNIEANIVIAEENMKKSREEKDKNNKEQEDAITTKTELQEEIEKITETINELEKAVSEFVTKNKDNQKTVDELNFDITNLKISVSSFDESELSLNEFIERIDTELNNNNKLLENKKSTIGKLANENKELLEKIKNIELEVANLRKLSTESVEKVNNLKEKRQSLSVKEGNLEEKVNNQFKVIEDIKAQITKIDVKKSKIEFEIEQTTNKMWEEYEITPNKATETYSKPNNVQEVQKRVNVLRNEIKNLGSINIDAIQEYKETKERYDFVCEQRLDLETTSAKLRKVIAEMTQTMKVQFEEQFKIINNNFSEVFKELFGGGRAELILVDESNVLESGIEIEVQPPGKKLQNMMLLSGGERAFTAIALLFAILKINPAPFCVLDEIEAALDDANVFRFADYLKKFAEHTQFLVITHRKGTMEAANNVYGITMEENGISKMLSIQLAK